MREDVVKRVRISKETEAFMDEFAEQKGIQPTHKNRTINLIVEEYKKMKEEEKWRGQLEENVVEKVSENIQKEVRKELSRILLG